MSSWVRVCGASSLPPSDAGSMVEVEFTPPSTSTAARVLLVRQDAAHGGGVRVVGARCPHYGAPLVKGVVSRGVLRCPWHAAAWHVADGAIEDGPVLDCLPSAPLVPRPASASPSADGDDTDAWGLAAADVAAFVAAPAPAPAPPSSSSSTGTCAHELPTTTTTTTGEVALIVGGGPAAVAAALALRSRGFRGRVLVVAREKQLPVDRPKLSKVLGIAADAIALRPAAAFAERNI
jgi:apoptosis-inducing factor 3